METVRDKTMNIRDRGVPHQKLQSCGIISVQQQSTDLDEHRDEDVIDNVERGSVGEDDVPQKKQVRKGELATVEQSEPSPGKTNYCDYGSLAYSPKSRGLMSRVFR